MLIVFIILKSEIHLNILYSERTSLNFYSVWWVLSDIHLNINFKYFYLLKRKMAMAVNKIILQENKNNVDKSFSEHCRLHSVESQMYQVTLNAYLGSGKGREGRC